MNVHPRINEVLSALDEQLHHLRAAVDEVPAEARQRRPADDRWSVAEILEHLAIVEERVMRACGKQLAAARESGLAQETDSSPIADLLPIERIANRERRLSAPAQIQPKGTDARSAWIQVENVRRQFHEFVISCDGLALNDVSFPHPVLGSLTIYQWFLFAAGHHARHAGQIREIAAQLQE